KCKLLLLWLLGACGWLCTCFCVLTPSFPAARCLQPVRTGSCRAAFPRFFYNASSGSCSSFIYGGCDGNDNNFESHCRFR
uniref:BPTI/Kunitz inhibitor domain-containing protein n=1 Tax=Oryzias sinensis TaxID=183150 RepID=A0A8C7WV87_9TELE